MTKLTKENKQEIISLFDKKKDQLGSYSKVATFLNISEATLSQLRTDSYKVNGDSMWLEVAGKLNWKPYRNDHRQTWQIAETTDYKSVYKILADAKNKSLFLPISDLAGIGKSAPLKAISEAQQSNGMFYIRCWDWGKREFLENLCRNLGIDTGRGYKTPNDLIQMVIEFFQNRALLKPLLIIDEADKMKPAAKRILIAVYNECEDILSVVIAGTDSLEKEIKRGVKFQINGYDEIDSRFGRKYIKLIGCTLKDTMLICQANGLNDGGVVKEIFEECNPIRKILRVQNNDVTIRVITDIRRLKRLVQKYQMKVSQN